MNRRHLGVVALVLISACKKADQPAPQPAEAAFTGLTVSDSFKTPESVLYDEAGDGYLVANVNGNPAEADNNGFISRVNPAGQVVSLHWIQGGQNGVTLNAPKGMGLRGDTLFVADITWIRMFHRNTGAPLGGMAVPGATFLNDVSVGPDGAVWFTDSGFKPDFSPSGTDAVWHRDPSGGAMHQVARGDALGHPNGILADSTGAVVVTFGSGEVYRVDTRGQRTPIGKPPKGQLDGVVRIADGTLMMSSWADSSIIAMKPGEAMVMAVINRVPSPADIGLDTRRNRLLIPIFTGNRIEIRPTQLPATAHAQ